MGNSTISVGWRHVWKACAAIAIAATVVACRDNPPFPRDHEIASAVQASERAQYERSAAPLRGTLSRESLLEAIGDPPVVTAFETRRCERVRPVGDPSIAFAVECTIEVEFNKTGRVLKTIVLVPATGTTWRVAGYR